MGLRWDMQDIPQPAHPFTTDPLALFYTNKIYISKLNFQPRFGFAWQVEKNTVVRAGYGMFFGNTTDSLFYNTRVENGVVQKTFACNVGYAPSAGSFGAGANCLQSTAAISGRTGLPGQPVCGTRTGLGSSSPHWCDCSDSGCLESEPQFDQHFCAEYPRTVTTFPGANGERGRNCRRT